jgi:hypothetical protein
MLGCYWALTGEASSMLAARGAASGDTSLATGG